MFKGLRISKKRKEIEGTLDDMCFCQYCGYKDTDEEFDSFEYYGTDTDGRDREFIVASVSCNGCGNSYGEEMWYVNELYEVYPIFRDLSDPFIRW